MMKAAVAIWILMVGSALILVFGLIENQTRLNDLRRRVEAVEQEAAKRGLR